jgi:hypothetical protein
MSLLSRLFVALGVFLIVVGGGYGVLAHDYEGLTLSITVAGGALLVGGYGMAVVRRTRRAVAGTAPAASTAADEPHVGPTIWPLVFAISTIGLVIGTVSNRWALLPGGVFFLVACVGWVLDVHRQWRHHAAEHGGSARAVPAPRDAAGADTAPVEDGAATGPTTTGAARAPGDGTT